MPRFVFAVFLIVAAMTSLPAQAAERTDKLVTVTGEATVAAAPDMALIRIGVTSQGKNARAASDANAREMTAVLAAIKETGVADKDIQTTSLSLQPQYDPNKTGAARLIGFAANNQVTVKIRDIGQLPTFSTAPSRPAPMRCRASNSSCPSNPSCSTKRAPRPSRTPAERPSFTPRPPA